MVNSLLQDSLKLDMNIVYLIKDDLAKINQKLQGLDSASPEYIVRLFYLDSFTSNVKPEIPVLSERYYGKIRGVLQRSLDQGRFSPQDAYFLKRVGCPYFSNIEVPELMKAIVESE
jgi:hypothetical protein